MSNSPVNASWLVRLRRGLTDLWFLLWVAVAIIILILLLAYHSTDPGWSTSGTSNSVQNWLGLPGAYLSDIIISTLGYAAYLLPIGLISIGWQSVKREYVEPEKMVWKSALLIIAVLVLGGIFAFHWPKMINSWAVTAGGVAGQKLSEMLLAIFSGSVAWVMGIYSVVFLVCLTVVFEINWLKVLEWIGLPVYLLYRFVIGKLSPNDEKPPKPVAEKTPKKQREKLRERLAPSLNPTPTEEPSEPSLGLDKEASEEAEDMPFTARPEPAAEAEDNLSWSDYKNGTTEAPSAEPVTPPPASEPTLSTAPTLSTEPPLEVFPTEPPAAEEANPFASYDAFKEETPPLADEASRPAAPIDDSLAAIQGDDDEDEAEAPVVIPPAGQFKVNINGGGAMQPVRSASTAQKATYHLPPLSLLKVSPPHQQDFSPEEQHIMAVKVEEALKNYRMDVSVVNVEVGPVVTRLELDLAPGIKVSQISNLDKDLARSLAVQSVRVVEVIPGKPYIGLEIPNRKREIVHLRGILESEAYQGQKSPLTIVLGDDIAGNPVVANLAKMPHLLVAGTTGSGKSVAINVMLASMLYKATPEELRLILIDPKMLEMSMYEDIPHLLTPVVTDMNDAENALRWAVAEMERRYQLMAAFKVRNLAGFNKHIRELQAEGERIDDPLWKPEENLGLANQPPQVEPLPNIVIVIDELADMMMAVGKKVEELIARIAQKARAAGIHLILATQRPSVDVITGLIKANVPTRLAFQVSSKIDSRTIIDQQGAEALLGYGDGLFVPPGSSAPQRVHGAFIEDSEVDALTSYLKTQGEPEYEESITNPVAAADMGNFGAQEKSDDPEQDPLYDEACQMVIESKKASISWLQRRLSIGYNRSARIIEAMERAGIVSAPERGTRKVLLGRDNDVH